MALDRDPNPLEVLEREREGLRQVIRQRSTNAALEALEGFEVLVEQAESGDIAALRAVQRLRAVMRRVETSRIERLPGARD